MTEIQKLLSEISNINDVKLKFREDITEFILTECLETNNPYAYFVFENEKNGLLYGAHIRKYDYDKTQEILFFETNELTGDDDREDSYAPLLEIKKQIEEKFNVRFASEYSPNDEGYYVCRCGNDKFQVMFERTSLWEHVFKCTECGNTFTDNCDSDDDNEENNSLITGFFN